MNTKSERDTYTQDVAHGRIDIMKNIEALQKLEEPQESENYREPLCVDTQVIKKITLSTGGPADGFKLYFDVYNRGQGQGTQLELSHGVYWRADWGEYQESALSESEAQTVFDFYLGGYAEI